MLRKNRHSLEALAEFLIVEETLTGQQVRDVLVCCSVLQYVAVCCNVLQCVAVYL